MKEWATKYNRCISCSKTDSMHTGHGLCRRCRTRLAKQNRSGKILRSKNIINNIKINSMQEIRIGDIVGNVENIQELQKVKLPVKVSYKIMRLANKLDPILKSFNESKDALIKEFGEKNADDDNYTVKDPIKLGEYVKKLGELLDTKEQVEFTPIPIADLGDVQLEASLLVPFIFE